MATLKQRMWRKNNAGTYDTIHLETESSLVLRPSGRTVEQDLTDFLPEVQATDDVPETLKRRKLVIGNSKAFLLDKALAFEGATTQVSWDNVTGKPEYYPPENHGHTIEQIEDLYNELRDINTSLDSKAEWPHKHDMSAIVNLEEDLSTIQSDIANKANIKHTHDITDVNNLQTQLNGKASASHSHAISDVTNLQTTLNGKAASSHNHSASNITSGTLPTSRGGTGITANPSMLVDLGRTTAASVFASAPRPGVTGTLPVSRGGTGVTSLDALKSSLNVSDELMLAIAARSIHTKRYDYNDDISIPIKISSVKNTNGRVSKVGEYFEFIITSWPSELNLLTVWRIADVSLGMSSGPTSNPCILKTTATYGAVTYQLQSETGTTNMFVENLGLLCNATITKDNYSKWRFRATVIENTGSGYVSAALNETTSIYEFDAF